MSIAVPPRDRSRWLALATLPFVLGAVMGCTHSLVAAIFLITLQLIPYAARAFAARRQLT